MPRLLIAIVLLASSALAADIVRPVAVQEPPTELLIVSTRTSNAEIFLFDMKTKEAKNLTKSNAENSYPAWSPDGKRIAFASDRDGGMNIYVMDADGGNVKPLTRGAERTRSPAWSPDGKKIAFGQALPQGGCGIYVMDADGGNVQRIGADDGWNPAWSPDGKRILFASRRGGDGFRIYAMDPDGGNVQQLNNNGNPFGSVYPSYSPDGKKIMWSDGTGDGLELHVADADGKNAQQITQLGGYNTFAIWSPDGKSIVFHNLPDYEAGPVFIMDAAGGNRRELLPRETLISGARPAWKPR